MECLRELQRKVHELDILQQVNAHQKDLQGALAKLKKAVDKHFLPDVSKALRDQPFDKTLLNEVGRASYRRPLPECGGRERIPKTYPKLLLLFAGTSSLEVSSLDPTLGKTSEGRSSTLLDCVSHLSKGACVDSRVQHLLREGKFEVGEQLVKEAQVQLPDGYKVRVPFKQRESSACEYSPAAYPTMDRPIHPDAPGAGTNVSLQPKTCDPMDTRAPHGGGYRCSCGSRVQAASSTVCTAAAQGGASAGAGLCQGSLFDVRQPTNARNRAAHGLPPLR
eukprot:6707435-Pyramimonas_sp.AAC.1